MELSRVIQKLTAPLKRRVDLMVRRAVVKLINDDRKMQELQITVMAGRTYDDVERWEDYGLTSRPLPGAEALVLALGGNSGHSAVVKVADRIYRFSGLEADGEVALYDDQGQVIHFKRGKEIEIKGCDKLTATVGQAASITAGVSISAIAPAVNLGAAAGLRKLIDERFLAMHNDHTHAGGVKPDQQADLGDVATSVTKAI